MKKSTAEEMRRLTKKKEAERKKWTVEHENWSALEKWAGDVGGDQICQKKTYILKRGVYKMNCSSMVRKDERNCPVKTAERSGGI